MIKGLYYVIQLVIAVLKKDSTHRTSEDIMILKKATENNPFFSNLIKRYGEETYNAIFQYLTYQYLEPDTILFTAGSIGSTFYILLEGSVGVIVKVPISQENGKIEYENKEVKVLNTGDSFGELAIMEDAIKPRAATIKSKEKECHLACLDRNNYRKILGMHQKRELDAKLEFLYSIPIFKSWSNHSLKTLTYMITIKHMLLKQVIYREGDPVDELYIIRSGEVKSLKSVKINQAIKDSEKLVIDEQNQVYTCSKDPLIKIAEIAVISSGQLFGEEEAYISYRKDKSREKWIRARNKKSSELQRLDSELLESTKRETTMICNSLQAEIWVVNKKSFFQKLEPYTPSHNMLLAAINQKHQWRMERIEELSKSTPHNPTLLVGISPMKSKPSENNDLITSIKYKQFAKKHKIVKSDPFDLQIFQSESQCHIKDLINPINDNLMNFKENHETSESPNNNQNKAHTHRSKTSNNGTMNLLLTAKKPDEKLIEKDKSMVYFNTISGNVCNTRNEEGINLVNKINYDTKKVLIPENPNLKFWNLKLDIITTIPSVRDNIINQVEKIPMSSIKSRPIFHDPQNLLITTMNTKKTIHEKLKNSSFAGKINFTTSITDQSQKNIPTLNKSFKNNIRESPLNSKDRSRNFGIETYREAKGIDKDLSDNLLKISFNKIEEQSLAKNIGKSLRIDLNELGKSAKCRPVQSNLFNDKSNQTWVANPQKLAKAIFRDTNRRAFSVNAGEVVESLSPLISNHGCNNIHVMASKSPSPVLSKIQQHLVQNIDLLPSKEAMNSLNMFIKSKLLAKATRSYKHHRNNSLNENYTNNHIIHSLHGNQANDTKPSDILLPGLDVIIKKYGEKSNTKEDLASIKEINSIIQIKKNYEKKNQMPNQEIKYRKNSLISTVRSKMQVNFDDIAAVKSFFDVNEDRMVSHMNIQSTQT